jgi:hypothetical protein
MTPRSGKGSLIGRIGRASSRHRAPQPMRPGAQALRGLPLNQSLFAAK